MQKIGTILEFLRRVYAEARSDDVVSGAAALGFYLTLAIFPAMICLMAIIPYLPLSQVDDAIMDLLRQALPPSAAHLFADVVREVTTERRGGVLSFGVVFAMWTASSGMQAVMRQLNKAYDVTERRRFVKARATALSLSLLFGVLVLGAFSLVVAGGVIQDWLGRRFGFSPTLLGFFVVFRWVIIVAALLLAIQLIYYLAPNREHAFRLVSAGGVTATVLLIGTSSAFRLYTANFGHYSAVYGSIGAVIVLMLWLFLAGLVILLGAEINVVRERDAAGGANSVGHESDPVAAEDAPPPRPGTR